MRKLTEMEKIRLMVQYIGYLGIVLWSWYSFCIWLSFLSGRTYSKTSLSMTQDFNLYGEMLFELFFIPFISITMLIYFIKILRKLKRLDK